MHDPSQTYHQISTIKDPFKHVKILGRKHQKDIHTHKVIINQQMGPCLKISMNELSRQVSDARLQ